MNSCGFKSQQENILPSPQIWNMFQTVSRKVKLGKSFVVLFIICLASSLEEISCLAGGSLRLIFWRSFVNTKDFRLVSQIRDWEQIKRSKLSRERKETFLWIRVLFGDWWIWMDCVAVSTFFLLRRTHLFVYRVDHQNSLKFLQMDFCKVHHKSQLCW